MYPGTGTARRRSPAIQSQQTDAGSPRLIRRRQLAHLHGQHFSISAPLDSSYTLL